MRAFRLFAVSLVLLLVGGTFSAWAQTKKVSGKVLDTQQQPVIGAVVMIQGTSNGTVTDVDGTFALDVPAGKDLVMEVSSLGYESQTVSVPADLGYVDVTLAEDSMLLSETVVVGYGTQKKVNLTGAITAVDSKALENRTANSLTNMLQGAVPGLNISTSTGNPGSTGSLNIRGITSINSAEPIVVIDGAIGDLSRVNPNDVESISVIKDAAAAAVYGARAAYGVILVTTKSGNNEDGKTTVRYSGRFGIETPTTSTDYETRGYWSVYTVDKFWAADGSGNYTGYTSADMAQLLARVNDKKENPARPWVVEDIRRGRKQWIYYANTDWYHELYRDEHPTTQHSISVSGGNKNVKYFLSGSYNLQTGILKVNPDKFQKYNLRSKIDIKVNKYINLSNNTSFYSSTYDYPGVGDPEDSFQYGARHALASFPLKNPDGSWLYRTPLIAAGSYNVANGRHIVLGNDKDKNMERRSDFSNTTELKITPVKTFNLVANFTYRLYQGRYTHRRINFDYRTYPDGPMEYYTSGAGQDQLSERVNTYQYYSGNVFGTYEETFANAHHVTAMVGGNMEYWASKNVGAVGQNLLSKELNDLDLVGPDETGAVITSVSGGQNDYALLGIFGRVNYDFKGRYLFEASARYDGSSRFAKGQRWGLFPSASIGWRISEEPFFAPAKKLVNNLKLRASYGTLGNQNVSYYSYLRTIGVYDFSSYTFGESSNMSKYSTLSGPVSDKLTWETSQQYNLGLDLDMLRGRLNFTGELYIRDTKNMLTKGPELPSIYGANPPKTNAADLRTKGYELSLSWRDEFKLGGHPFGYSVRATLSDYVSHITRFDNKDKKLNDYYEGERLGDIWGFVVDGLFESDEEATEYTTNVLNQSAYISNRLFGGWMAGDLKFRDLDGNKILGIGDNTLKNPGDRKILGNSLPSMQYGFNLALDYFGFDVSAFFQGTGTHYWYPAGGNYGFWGPYSYSYASFIEPNFLQRCWSEENPDAYFPRPRSYSSTGGQLRYANSRYIQNIRYLRLKNFTVGYSLPKKAAHKIGMEQFRVYFSGENLAYWSPIKKYTKYVDPESAFTRGGDVENDHMAYPWMKTFMVGIDITF